VTTTGPDAASGAPTSTNLLPRLIDQISLEAALLDFEVANARVVDLTKRLVEATDDLIRLQNETEFRRLEAEALRREADLLRLEAEAARGSRAYKLARQAHGLVRLLRK
jgi:hypothetical protein